MTEPKWVVEASAVLAWLFGERGEDTVDRVLGSAALSTVNLAEVLYRAEVEGMETLTLQQDLEGYGVTIVTFTDEDARLVQEVRRASRRERLRLSLADCCCLATGIRMNLPVVGGDRAWEPLDLGIEIHPFR